MEYEKIKQLIDDMGDSKLTSIKIDFPDGTKISMKKESNIEKIYIDKKADLEDIQIKRKEDIEDVEENASNKGNIIKSPMVGTFYLRPSPTLEPYVEVGKNVKAGDTLCIIEAMKLMNEIESEFSGKIVEILVEDGQSVEYSTPLFRIE